MCAHNQMRREAGVDSYQIINATINADETVQYFEFSLLNGFFVVVLFFHAFLSRDDDNPRRVN